MRSPGLLRSQFGPIHRRIDVAESVASNVLLIDRWISALRARVVASFKT